MNQSERKLLILISKLPPMERNVYSLVAKMDRSYSGIYNYLRIMEAKGWIKRIKSGSGKTFYQIVNEEMLEIAKE